MHGLSGCITSARFNMLATVMRQYAADGDVTPDEGGYYEFEQDPVTGAIIREWHLADPDEPAPSTITIPCAVRGITDGGIRASGTTERFGAEYLNIDWARMRFPAGYMLTKRDRITNIRSSDTGKILWVEAESAVPTGQPNEYRMYATVFNVNGVTPEIDPYGNHIENIALLEKAEDSVGGDEVVVTYA